MNQDFNCIPSDYPPFEDLELQIDSPDLFDVTSQFLVPEYQFGCKGRISLWEVYTVGNGSHPIEFSVWRLSSTEGATSIYILVGSNYVMEASPNQDNLLSISILPEDRIQVQPGDITGLRSVLFDDTAVSPFQIQLDSAAGSGGVLNYTLNKTEATPQSISVETSTLQQSAGTPVLRVTVEGKCIQLHQQIVVTELISCEHS